jgi:hypothetical protein
MVRKDRASLFISCDNRTQGRAIRKPKLTNAMPKPLGINKAFAWLPGPFCDKPDHVADDNRITQYKAICVYEH